MSATPLLPTDCCNYELYDINTETLRPPYAPAVAKPFHLVAEHAFDAEHTFKTEMVGDEMLTGTIVDAQCAFGRNGTFLHGECTRSGVEEVMKLAICGCVADDVMGHVHVADFILCRLNAHRNHKCLRFCNKQWLSKPSDDIEQVLAAFGRSGFMLDAMYSVEHVPQHVAHALEMGVGELPAFMHPASADQQSRVIARLACMYRARVDEPWPAMCCPPRFIT